MTNFWNSFRKTSLIDRLQNLSWFFGKEQENFKNMLSKINNMIFSEISMKYGTNNLLRGFQNQFTLEVVSKTSSETVSKTSLFRKPRWIQGYEENTSWWALSFSTNYAPRGLLTFKPSNNWSIYPIFWSETIEVWLVGVRRSGLEFVSSSVWKAQEQGPASVIGLFWVRRSESLLTSVSWLLIPITW